MRHLVIGQRQKAPNFSAFHWSPHGCLITIGQHFVTTRVVHLPKRTETSLINESDQNRANHQLLQLCTVRTAWSDSDQAVRAVHSCKSWFCPIFACSIWDFWNTSKDYQLNIELKNKCKQIEEYQKNKITYRSSPFNRSPVQKSIARGHSQGHSHSTWPIRLQLRHSRSSWNYILTPT